MTTIFQNVYGDGVKMENKTVKADCQKHGAFKRIDVKLPSGEWQEGLCSKCETEEHEKNMKESENRKNNDIRKSNLRCMGIPKRFTGKVFENYETGESRGKEKALSICKRYATGFKEISDKGICLTLCGLPGTGKTHLACAIANYLGSDSGHGIKFTGVYKAISEVKSTFSGGGESEREVYERFTNLKLLILDEVGVQFGTKTEELIMFEILNRRYEAMKPTILISNLKVDELKEFIGERVMDRIKEGGGPVIAFDWESYRK